MKIGIAILAGALLAGGCVSSSALRSIAGVYGSESGESVTIAKDGKVTCRFSTHAGMKADFLGILHLDSRDGRGGRVVAPSSSPFTEIVIELGRNQTTLSVNWGAILDPRVQPRQTEYEKIILQE